MVKASVERANGERGSSKSAAPAEREYNGHPVLTLNPDSRFPFTFGPAKAEMILEHLETIRAFAAKHAARPGAE
jgi:hypothetical protein